MKISIIGILFFFVSLNINAQEITKEIFCESLQTVIANQTNIKKLSAIQAFQILYFTRTLISPQELNTSEVVINNYEQDKNDEKIIFVNLPDSPYSKNEIEDFKKLKKEITHLKLFKKLKKNQDENYCLKNIETYPNDFKKFVQFINESNSNQELQENYKNSRLFSLAIHQLKSFKRKGWQIRTSKNIFDFFSQVESNHKITQVILVNHSDELGRLYDAEKNIYPKGAFSNLPRNIKRLAIFSCHPKEVIKYYQIEKIANELSYYYPEIKEKFSDFFGETIPVLAIRAMMNVGSKPINRSNETELSCKLNFQLKQNTERVIVSLNDSIVSAGELHQNDSKSFKCKILNNINDTIKIYSLNSKDNAPIQVTKITLQDKDNSEININLKEYLSSDKKRHLVTIGTIGG